MPKRPGVIDADLVPEASPEVVARLRRLRWLAWVMDRSIPIGGGRRIGLDPLLGLMPGVGDWLGAAISIVLVYDGIRLGLPVRVLARMMLNIGIEASVGAVPILGDIFDAAWQANQRNLKLVERHYDARLKPRPLSWIPVAFLVFAGVFLAVIAVIIVLVVRFVWALMEAEVS